MDIFKRLNELNFPLGSYVVVGSGLLAALGIREANDIDIAVNAKLRDELAKDGRFRHETRYGKLFLVRDDVEIITQLNWEDYHTKVDEAIESAQIINGFPFLNIEETIKFKKALGREKDHRDIELLDGYPKIRQTR